MKKLAIVIPAYKDLYLKETLTSIANQTCKDFTLYIGDDNSPYDLYKIVRMFDQKIDIVYKKFDQNIGGTDLVSQWERCIEMTNKEPWIWLFSDDDTMDPTCVERFYAKVQTGRAKLDLYHFDVSIINAENEIIYYTNFPELVDSEYLFINKIKGTINLFAVEFIFSREVYLRCHGFQNFDMAWGSDIATWLKFGLSGIKTISGPRVNWRSSGENITTQISREVLDRKMSADFSYLLWVKNFWRMQGKNKDRTIDSAFIRRFFGYHDGLSFKKCLMNSKEFLNHGNKAALLMQIYLYYIPYIIYKLLR